MERGDISNESSPRIIVLIDVVAKSEIEESRRVFSNKSERKVTGLESASLIHLWNMANKFGLSVELAAFGGDQWTQEHLDKLMDKLDRRGGNPFNYAELYENIEDFIGELPYRANLKGVIDLPGRVARYGSWGIELQNL
jgi:hypothetical protein